MTTTDNHVVSVYIQGKHYSIKCPPEQAQALQASAQIIESKLHEMKQTAYTANTERMLVVIALNLCHELLLLKNEQSANLVDIEHKLNDLQTRIQLALSHSTEKLEVEDEVAVA